ncbi:MAG: tetratricopeptide repeat protein [Rhizobiaceae bacterium]
MTDRAKSLFAAAIVGLMWPISTYAAGESLAIDPKRLGAPAPDDAYGAYQRGLYKTALSLAQERAKTGDAEAMTLAAEILSRGLGVPRDLSEAARLYAMAADKGVLEARFQTALFMLEGKYLTKDLTKAKEHLEKAVAGGHKLAAFNLAQLVMSKAANDAERKQAYDLFMVAADAGLADAQYAVSQFLANGTGGVPYDEAKARVWLEKAARQSYDTAMLDYASWLIDGIGGKKDYEAGFAWMKRAAEAGNVAAQRQLARLYESGIGTKGDTVTAAAWYVIAKRAGLKDTKLDDLLDGLTDAEMKKAIELANRLK